MFETEFLGWFRHLRLDYMLFRVIFFVAFEKIKEMLGFLHCTLNSLTALCRARGGKKIFLQATTKRIMFWAHVTRRRKEDCYKIFSFILSFLLPTK